MGSRRVMENLIETLSEIRRTGGTDEQWKQVFQAVGYLRESFNQIYYQVRDDIEDERLARVKTRGGA